MVILPTAPLATLHRQLAQAPALRVGPIDQLHLTLRFLGEVSGATLPGVAEAVRQATRGVGPIDLSLYGVGAFPSVRRVSVVWVGCVGSALRDVVDRLTAPLESLGIPADARPWTGHVTLARVKGGTPTDFERVRELIRRHETLPFGAVRIHAVHVMTSDLTPNGAKHSVCETIELK